MKNPSSLAGCFRRREAVTLFQQVSGRILEPSSEEKFELSHRGTFPRLRDGRSFCEVIVNSGAIPILVGVDSPALMQATLTV